VLTEDETHINLLPRVRATWVANSQRQQVMTPGTNGGGQSSVQSTCGQRPVAPQVARKAVSATFTQSSSNRWRLPGRARRRGDLRQRDHPPLQDRQTVA
jgi:hypothetical protein